TGSASVVPGGFSCATARRCGPAAACHLLRPAVSAQGGGMHIDWLSGIPVIPEHPLLLWAFALTAGAVLFFALSAALRIARTRLQRRAEMPGHPLARSLSEVLRRTNSVLLLILSLLIGAEIVGAPLPWSGRNAQH